MSPDVVIGDPETLNALGTTKPTLVTVPVLSVKPSGLVALYGVKPKPVVISELVRANVPPNVRSPVVVTVPVNVKPLTVPVPPTLVTLPAPEPATAASTYAVVATKVELLPCVCGGCCSCIY